ncbi:MAG: hypothetical protein ACPGXX_22495 [Planctomycetaceae bacterium]
MVDVLRREGDLFSASRKLRFLSLRRIGLNYQFVPDVITFSQRHGGRYGKEFARI